MKEETDTAVALKTWPQRTQRTQR